MAAAGFSAGDIVKGLFLDGEWYLATVEDCNGDGTYTVTWFDGDESCRVRRPEELRRVHYSEERGTFEEEQSPGEAEEGEEAGAWPAEPASLPDAVLAGDEVAVGKLLAARANPNMWDSLGDGLLQSAAAAGSRPIVALLLSARADPSGVAAPSAAGDAVLQELLEAPQGVCSGPAIFMAQAGLSLEARHALLLASQRLEGRGGNKASPQVALPRPPGRQWQPLVPPEAEEEEEEGGYSMASWIRPANSVFSRGRGRGRGSRDAPEERRRPELDAKATLALLEELHAAYSSEEFANAAGRLASVLEKEGNPAAKMASIDGLCMAAVLQRVLRLHGFSPDEEGSKELKAIITEHAGRDTAVRDLNLRVMQLVMGYFRKRPAPKAKSGKKP